MNSNMATGYFQKGVATLTVTVVILVITTLMVFFATRVGLLDQRMAGNEVRYKEAFAQAEAGLDFATQRFNNQFKLNYDGESAATSLATILTNSQVTTATEADGTSPESGEGSFTVSITDSGAALGSIPVYNFVSTGISADGTGTATVQRQITMTGVMGGESPDIPIVVGGAVGTGGDFNVVGNPNGGGPGIPVSVWTGPTGSGANIEMSGSSATCHIQYYSGNNAQCSNPSGNSELLSQGDGSTLTSYSPDKPDLLPNDANFPDDLFAFVFGLPRTDWQLKKNEAANNGQVVSDCSVPTSLGANAGTNFSLWWITGDCDPGSNATIGSDSKPVILVIDDGELEMNAGTVIHGIVFLFNNPDNAGTPSASMSGSPEIYGSFISDVGGAGMHGSYSVVYDPDVINSFEHGGGSNFSIGYIPGSWRDFQ